MASVVGLLTVALLAGCSRRQLAGNGVIPTADAATDVPDAAVDRAVADQRIDQTVATDGPGVDVSDAQAASDAPSRVCPSIAPRSGQSCIDRVFGLLCSYAEPTPSTCSTRCECRGQSWFCDRPCAGGICPASPPSAGGSCSLGARCSYPTPCGPREYMCIAFEVGAPTSWTCLTQCGCDAGPDAPADASAEVPADASGDAPADAAAD